MFYLLKLLRTFPTPLSQFRAGLEPLHGPTRPTEHSKGGVGKQVAQIFDTKSFKSDNELETF